MDHNRFVATRKILRRFFRNATAVFGAATISLVLIIATVGPFLYNVSSTSPSYSPLLPPFSTRPLGTDDLGRDIMAQMMAGARVSMIVAFFAAISTVFIGLTVGAVSGYKGGAIDSLLMRITDIFLMIPTFILMIVVLTIFAPSTIEKIILVMGLLAWPVTARLTRAQFLTLKQQQFVDAQRVMGVKERTIIFRQILPNAASPLIVQFSYEMATAILTEAGLSFLGLGDPNNLSWGYMLYESIPFLRSAWWMSLFPGIAIFLMVLSLNLLGDGVNESLSPYVR